MRFLLSTCGSRGDVDAMVGLAVRLQALGAEVRVCAPPEDEFVQLSARVRVPLVPFGPPEHDTLAEAAEDCDVLVASGRSLRAARSVAETVSIPLRCVAFSPTSLAEPDARTRYGNRPLLATDQTLGPWHGPSDIDAVQTGAWILPDTRPLPSELQRFLAAGSQPVYVDSLRVPTAGACVAIDAIRAQGRRAVVSSGLAELASIRGDDCFAVGEVNQQALFGRVAAVVHHGDAGTTTAAARAGTPQVVLPQVADQTYWAGRVAELAIGTAHYDTTPTAASLAAALGTVLTPETRTRAAAVAKTVRVNGATVAATLLYSVRRERAARSA